MRNSGETVNSILVNWPDRLIFWGLVALFFFLPWATSGVVLAGGIVIAAWLFSGKCRREREKWLCQPWTGPVAFFLLLPWAALLWSPDLTEGLDWATKNHVWLIAFAAAGIAGTGADWRFLLRAFLAGLALVSLVSLGKHFGLIPWGNNIPSLLGANSITGSLFLVWGMALLVGEWGRAATVKRKVAITALALLFFVTLAATGGRAGYLAFVLLAPVMLYRLLGKRMILVAASFIVALGLLLSSQVAENRLEKIGRDLTAYREGNPNTSIGLRLVMWEGAVKIFAEHPLLGAGTGGYKSEMAHLHFPGLAPEFKGIDDPHNSFLFMGANYGLVGLFSLFWLFYAYFRRARVFAPSLASWAIFSFGVVFLIGSLTGTEIMSAHSRTLFAVLTGLAITRSDGLVKSPDAAYAKSTPHSSGFARQD